MSNKIKVSFNGREVEATPITIQQANEYWNVYLLDDGSTIKLKAVSTKIVRIDNTYDSEGNPVYLVKSTNILAVDSLESLKRKG